jgi:pyruvate dehydrogenase complex dehydrogenase (E1) component
MTGQLTAPATDDLISTGLDTLREVEQRVLWLSTAIVDHANRVRPNPTGPKVGGHQASSASITSIMTALWFEHLRAEDRVSVKPHASPVLHAIEYLILHWRERPTGQHIELGIAETNLVGLLGELGATWSRWGEPLLPIGVLYDPFVTRALEPWSFGIYAGGQSILVGTPSGVTLAPEGGAHQSITTPSVGIEQPGCTTWEPAFALDTEWCLLAALGQLGRPGGTSAYLRLSTRPVDQSLAAIPADPAARERRRRQVVAGGYALRRTPGTPGAAIVAMGALVPEALQAAERLEKLGAAVDIICVTSPDLLFRAVRGATRQQRRTDVDPGRALPAGPCRARGDGAGRTPPHPGLPGRADQDRRDASGRHPVRAVWRPGERVPCARDRRRQHRRGRTRPHGLTDQET